MRQEENYDAAGSSGLAVRRIVASREGGRERGRSLFATDDKPSGAMPISMAIRALKQQRQETIEEIRRACAFVSQPRAIILSQSAKQILLPQACNQTSQKSNLFKISDSNEQ